MPESANEHLDWLKDEIGRRRPGLILDIGMGRGNYGWFLRNVAGYRGRLVGIEVWEPYVLGDDALAGGNRSYYDEILVADVRDLLRHGGLPRAEMTFAFDVIEHFDREEGVAVLRALQRQTTGDVLVSVPIVHYEQGAPHGNPHEIHRAQWTAADMTALGSEFVHRGEATGMFRFPGGWLDRAVSVLLNTARDNALVQADGYDVLRSPADDLARQTGVDPGALEFIVVDGLFADRWETFAAHRYPFRVLHVPPRPTPMVRAGKAAIAAYKNSAIAHARGDLLLTIDDAAVLDDGFLARCVAAADRGVCLSALCTGVGMETVADTRTLYLDGDGRCLGPVHGNPMVPPMYGFVAVPLAFALAVNGYDEMYDGSRGIEDMDMGIRLQKVGARIALDQRHLVRLHPHGPWSESLFGSAEQQGTSTVVKCCQTTYRIQWDRVDAGEVQANRRPWTAAEWARLAPRCEHLRAAREGDIFGVDERPRCGLNGHPCPYVGICADREHPELRLLRDEPPVFDLGALRRDAGIVLP